MFISRELRARLEERPPGRAVVAALESLFQSDEYLLKVDANERSISFRFGMHLQAQLPNHHVDCEYNRTGVDPKRVDHLFLETDVADTEGKTVFPDVIAHVRGGKKNYLVVEFKKTSNRVSHTFDLQKLRGYKGDERLQYEYALFIELAVGEQPAVAQAIWIDV